MCPVAAPLVDLLDVEQARCHGIRQGEGISRVQVVKADIQENGHDCGVWAMYALYTRVWKRAIQYARPALFKNMDMTCPRDALNFRYMPLPSLQAAQHSPARIPASGRIYTTASSNPCMQIDCCVRPMQHSAHHSQPMHTHVTHTLAMFHKFCSRQPMSLKQCFLQPMYDGPYWKAKR